ncbi:MAG: hypothetical protein AAF355_10060 [Myxococcota bacterium]
MSSPLVRPAGIGSRAPKHRLSERALSVRERGVMLYAAVGVSAILIQAIARLAPLALEPWVSGSMDSVQIAIYLGWVGLNAYAEGYRAFQLRWAPRVVQRAYYVGRHGSTLEAVLAPIYSMGLFGGSRRSMLVSWTLLLCVALAVLVVRQFPQPWRGIVDGGVVVALCWGLIALWRNVARWWNGYAPIPADLSSQAHGI